MNLTVKTYFCIPVKKTLVYFVIFIVGGENDLLENNKKPPSWKFQGWRFLQGLRLSKKPIEQKS